MSLPHLDQQPAVSHEYAMRLKRHMHSEHVTETANNKTEQNSGAANTHDQIYIREHAIEFGPRSHTQAESPSARVDNRQ